MAQCSHGVEFDADNRLACPHVCQDPNCGHACHWHYGQCFDAPENVCEQCNTAGAEGTGQPACAGYQDDV